MHQNSLKVLWIYLVLAGSFCFPGLAQDPDAGNLPVDSLSTPFRKGRWLSGLNGSFSSFTLRIQSDEEPVTSNAYGLQIFTGLFFKDRWFAGLSVFAESSTGQGLVSRESESLLIGPLATYYFLEEPYGSLYLSLLPGYLRVRESGSVEFNDQVIRETSEGPGFATRISLGFAYAISDSIVLDVGVGSTFAWLDAEFSSSISGDTRSESIFSNSTFFSFGFNVLLDEFFF